MNQNNNQKNVRQITAVEIAQAQGRKLTPEELQETQVLNLQEVQETVRFEKLTSKKPAILVAILGMILIGFGSGIQINQVLKAKEQERQKEIAKREEKRAQEQEMNTNTYYNCVKTTLNLPDGTDTVYSITYDFKEDKLVGFTKVFNATKTAGNELGANTIQSYTIGYQRLLNPIPGYDISVYPTNNGITANVKVDLETINLTSLNPIQATHISTKVDYPLYEAKTKIQTDMLAQGFTCK